MRLKVAGVAKIRAGGEVHLPETVLDELGWKPGDSLFVEVLDGGRVVVSKDHKAIVDYFAGALTDLYPDPEDTRRFLDEGRGYFDESNPDIEP